jgi:aminoglycoside phosphotransferase (APT) family kinase protein
MTRGANTTEQLLTAIRVAAGNYHVAWAEAPAPLSGGFWAQMWRVRLDGHRPLAGDLVARVMPEPVIATRETAVQTYLASAGYPTPTVRLAAPPGPNLDRAWMLMDHAPGQPLLADLSGPDALSRLPRIARALPDTLARHTAQLHRIDPSPVQHATATGDDIDSLLQSLHDHAAGIDRSDLADAAERLHRHRPRSDLTVICHGDLHPFNILTHPDGDTVLDWSATRLAHPAYDIAFTHLLLRHPPLDAPTPLRPIVELAGRALARRFLTSYQRQTGQPVDPGQLDWFHRLHALRILTEVGSWHANDELDKHPSHPFLQLTPIAANLISP